MMCCRAVKGFEVAPINSHAPRTSYHFSVKVMISRRFGIDCFIYMS
jgi:hypothetical protein